MKKNLIISSVLIILLISTVFFATRVLYPKVSDLEQKLMFEANEINKTCPAMIDEATRLDNSTVFPNNVFQYNYTLFNISRTDVNVDMAIKNLEPKIIESIKKDSSLLMFKNLATTLNYNYKDRNGEFIFKIVITPNKYKKN